MSSAGGRRPYSPPTSSHLLKVHPPLIHMPEIQLLEHRLLGGINYIQTVGTILNRLNWAIS